MRFTHIPKSFYYKSLHYAGSNSVFFNKTSINLRTINCTLNRCASKKYYIVQGCVFYMVDKCVARRTLTYKLFWIHLNKIIVVQLLGCLRERNLAAISSVSGATQHFSSTSSSYSIARSSAAPLCACSSCRPSRRAWINKLATQQSNYCIIYIIFKYEYYSDIKKVSFRIASIKSK